MLCRAEKSSLLGDEMKLIIKNMVCPRCVMAVRELAEQQRLPVVAVGMGWVELSEPLATERLQLWLEGLQALGFSLVERPEDALVVEVHRALIELVRSSRPPRALSLELSERLGQEYEQLSRTFSARTGRTLERAYIQQRIGYAKELLEYGELSIKEIAYRLHYSSVAHFSRQFKQVAGLTASAYQEQRHDERQREGLDTL